MKNKFLLSAGLMLLFFAICTATVTSNEKEAQKKSITVLSAPDVQNLADVLVGEYRKTNPGITCLTEQITNSESKISIDESKVVIATEKSVISVGKNSDWKMLIGRDVVIPVINTDSPFCELIDRQGISAEKLKMVISESNSKWGTLLDNGEKQDIRLYILDDETVQVSVAEFLGVSLSAISKFKKVTPEEMHQLMQKDKYALGFCRFLDIANSNQENFEGNIKILPLDKNENGRLDYHEKIYGNIDSFKRGVWLGKYPGALVHNIYFVTATRPDNENVAAFLNWIVVDGQQFLEPSGYNKLVYAEKKSKLDELNRAEIPVGFTKPETTGFGPVLLIIIGIAVVVLVFGFFIRGKIKSVKISGDDSGKPAVLNENSVDIPNGLYFDKTHTWSFMEKDGTVRVGIDDFMQNITGQYTAVKMKDPGERIMKNEAFLTLAQDGKQINLYAPVSGKIKEINEDLVTEPSLINNSPYDEGWVYTIEPSNWTREIGFLKMAANYKDWLKSEFVRLKDFLAKSVNAEHQVVYQEGGEISANVLQQLGPHTWEDFQKNFIDNSDIN